MEQKKILITEIPGMPAELRERLLARKPTPDREVETACQCGAVIKHASSLAGQPARCLACRAIVQLKQPEN